MECDVISVVEKRIIHAWSGDVRETCGPEITFLL
jgi:hypothetical protein